MIIKGDKILQLVWNAYCSDFTHLILKLLKFGILNSIHDPSRVNTFWFHLPKIEKCPCMALTSLGILCKDTQAGKIDDLKCILMLFFIWIHIVKLLIHEEISSLL